ncbi:MAG: fatty acyl-AMP ligase [Planctomycetota bacterium]|nr:fatty acyl-AMP ligase [Planctomycetota bacterium]
MAAERSMAEILRRRAAASPDKLAFQFLLSDGAEGPRCTYVELDRQARSIATALRRITSPGERALLLYAPGLDFIPAFFGCSYAGVIAVPAYPPRPEQPWHGVEGLTRLTLDCRAGVVLTGGDYAADIERLCRPVAPLDGVPWLDTSDLTSAARGGWSREAEDPAAISHLQYTSGSTGNPKGVVVSHGNLMHNEYMIALCSGHFETAAAGICGVGWLPFQHDLGLVAGMLQAVYVGGPLVLMSPVTMLQRPYVWLEAISRYRGYTSGGPNFAYDQCVRRLSLEERASLDLSCWKVAGLGAEPVRVATMDDFAEAFEVSGFRREAFYPSYGLAEGTLMVAGGDRETQPPVVAVSTAALERNEVTVVSDTAADARLARTLVGCGYAWLDQQVLIVDPTARTPLPPARIGEIWVSGPSIARGYWNRPSDTQETFQARLNGVGEVPFLRTGDLGFFHEGELFITGRLKDVLIVRGQNHYPHDIELTVQGLDPALRSDAGAAFQTEGDAGERLVIVQEVLRPGKTFDADALARRVRQAVAEQHGIEVHDVVFVRHTTLPKTTSGKIQRHACKAAYEAGRLIPYVPKEPPRL